MRGHNARVGFHVLFLVVDGVEAAREALERGGFDEVITDGLKGGWEDVKNIARDLPVKLLSGDTVHIEAASKVGVPFFDKAYYSEQREKLVE